MTARLLWYTPAARRSKTGATTTIPASRAARDRASVVGPGTFSARSKKRGVLPLAEVPRAEQLRQARDHAAPPFAASRTIASPFSRFSSGSGPMAICRRATANRVSMLS